MAPIEPKDRSGKDGEPPPSPAPAHGAAQHYFSREPTSRQAPLEFEAWLLGKRLLLATDAGVFSRERVDPGTRLLVESLVVPEGASVLDLGCGYGPVGLAVAAACPQSRVVLVDVNPRACELARRNASTNGLANVEVREGDGYAAVAGLRFDLIASNPPLRAGKALVHGWVDQAPGHLRPGGSLWMVARTRQGAESLQRKMAEVFGEAEIVGRGSGYKVLRAIAQAAGS